MAVYLCHLEPDLLVHEATVVEAEPGRVRGLDMAINRVIGEALKVTALYVPLDEAERTSGLIRSASVAPPPTETGELRVIDIDGLDRQACGGTHLSNTAQSHPVTVTKIENKGRHNRRIRIRLQP